MKHNIYSGGSDIHPTAAKKRIKSKKTKSAEKQSTKEKERVVNAFDWPDEKSNLLAQHLRYEPKRFGWRRPNPDNLPNLENRADLNDPDDKKQHWIYNLDEPNAARVKEIPYRIQEHLRATNDRPVTEPIILVEGEHDYETCWNKGLFAVTFSGGANVWRKEYNAWFDPARPIMILTHNDKAGKERGRIAASSLRDEKPDRIIKIILLPDLSEGGDITNWLNQGHNVKELNHIIENTIEFKARQTGSRLIVKRLSDVESVPVQWLWFPRFAQGKVSLLVGNPGVGKSFVSLDMAARISTGALWPDGDNLPDGANRAQKGSSLLLTAEDGLDDTVRPRLDKMGADCSTIFAIQGSYWESDKKPTEFPVDDETCRPEFFNLLRDIELLENKVKQLGDVRTIIIDPLDAYYGARADTHQNALVRAVLGSLAELAQRHHICIIGISHLRKSSADLAMYRVMGSIGQIAAARTAWVIQPDKENKNRRRLLCLKNNLCREQSGLAFEIRDGRVEYEPGIITETADEAFEDESNTGPGVQVAIEFLDEYFAREPEPFATEVRKKAFKAGISNRTLERTKAKMGIISTQYPSGWRWKLPEQKPEKSS